MTTSTNTNDLPNVEQRATATRLRQLLQEAEAQGPPPAPAAADSLHAQIPLLPSQVLRDAVAKAFVVLNSAGLHGTLMRNLGAEGRHWRSSAVGRRERCRSLRRTRRPTLSPRSAVPTRVASARPARRRAPGLRSPVTSSRIACSTASAIQLERWEPNPSSPLVSLRRQTGDLCWGRSGGAPATLASGWPIRGS